MASSGTKTKYEAFLESQSPEARIKIEKLVTDCDIPTYVINHPELVAQCRRVIDARLCGLPYLDEKFPDIAQSIDQEAGIPEPMRILAKTMTKYLDQAVRELVVTVKWRHSEGERKVVLTTYLVDLNAEFNFSI